MSYQRKLDYAARIVVLKVMARVIDRLRKPVPDGLDRDDYLLALKFGVEELSFDLFEDAMLVGALRGQLERRIVALHRLVGDDDASWVAALGVGDLIDEELERPWW